ncbi:FxsA family protein [Halarchaeum nitratireducens]|uniref:Membrane protein FxsA n=1 Tax=Halarchaeum nitratireducens TaxID=489913 RepID=A0A830G6Z0_9EURY|nr:FxsA family protein [Halarchaeum nitratireducens]GGN07233.1 membrane protein FxsA [Halarchaeum nitratireducens]
MAKRLIAGLLLIPLADALLLVASSAFLDWRLIVALVVLTGLLGMLAVRAEGRHTLRRIQRSLARGEPPTDELVDGGLLVAAGAFLLTPGFVTDVVGFLLVFPPTRRLVRGVVKSRFVVPKMDEMTGGFATGNVYTFGFPSGDGGMGPMGGSGPRPGGSGGPGGRRDGDTVDIDEEAYDVEFDDEDGRTTD